MFLYPWQWLRNPVAVAKHSGPCQREWTMKISRGRPSLVGWVAMGNLVLLAATIAILRCTGAELVFIEWLTLALCVPLNWVCLVVPRLGGPHPIEILAFLALAPINAYLWARLVTWPLRRRRRDSGRSKEQTGAPATPPPPPEGESGARP